MQSVCVLVPIWLNVCFMVSCWFGKDTSVMHQFDVLFRCHDCSVCYVTDWNYFHRYCWCHWLIQAHFKTFFLLFWLCKKERDFLFFIYLFYTNLWHVVSHIFLLVCYDVLPILPVFVMTCSCFLFHSYSAVNSNRKVKYIIWKIFENERCLSSWMTQKNHENSKALSFKDIIINIPALKSLQND